VDVNDSIKKGQVLVLLDCQPRDQRSCPALLVT
jgi:hypothetical protein